MPGGVLQPELRSIVAPVLGRAAHAADIARPDLHKGACHTLIKINIVRRHSHYFLHRPSLFFGYQGPLHNEGLEDSLVLLNIVFNLVL